MYRFRISPAPPGTRWTPRVENKYGTFVLIDTAGIRRKSKVEDAIERYSVLRAYMAVERADVCADPHRCHRGLYGAGLQGGRLSPMKPGKGCIICGQ